MSESSNGRVFGSIARITETRQRGFGFIVTANGDEYFMHRMTCIPQSIFAELIEGDVVSFMWAVSPKGHKTVDVRLCSAAERDAYVAGLGADGGRVESRGNR